MSILVHTLQVHLTAPEKLRGKMDKRKLHSFTWIWSSFRVDPLSCLAAEFQEVTSVFCLLLLKFY